MATKAFPPVAAFGVAVAVALMCTWIAIGARDIEATQPHVAITGTLAEATTFGRRSSPTLELRMHEAPVDFRLDPGLFKQAMHKEVPADLRPGARISVLVIEEQYAHPLTPPGQSARIVWFRGLTIGDREVFGLAQTRAWEESNQRWSYVLLALALLGVAYYGVKWLRTR
jgi:hypothetical protein